jgi:Fur family transcriptional regulator, ferric uptake regulator
VSIAPSTPAQEGSSTGDGSLGSVPVSMSPQERFEEYLQRRGQRNTEQRRFLIERVFSHHEHFDADQLMEQLPRKGHPNYVSRPTVYRTLKEFVDAGLLRSFELNGRAVYEHDYGYPAHDHLYCEKCKSLIEFQSDELTTLINAMALQHKFRVRGHRLTVEGVCDACSKQRSRERRRQDRV